MAFQVHRAAHRYVFSLIGVSRMLIYCRTVRWWVLLDDRGEPSPVDLGVVSPPFQPNLGCSFQHGPPVPSWFASYCRKRSTAFLLTTFYTRLRSSLASSQIHHSHVHRLPFTRVSHHPCGR